MKALLRSSTPQLTLLGLLWILYVGVLRGICYPLFSVYSSSYELNFEATVAPTLLLQHQKKKPTPSRTSPGTFIQKSTFNVYMATQHIKCLSSSAYEVILKAVQMRCIYNHTRAHNPKNKEEGRKYIWYRFKPRRSLFPCHRYTSTAVYSKVCTDDY